MSNLNIVIGADSSQVQQARKQVELLGSTINTTRKMSQIDIGVNQEELQAALQKIDALNGNRSAVNLDTSKAGAVLDSLTARLKQLTAAPGKLPTMQPVAPPPQHRYATRKQEQPWQLSQRAEQPERRRQPVEAGIVHHRQQSVQETIGTMPLEPKQLAGMDTATRRIAQNLMTWQTAASKARNELKQLQADIKGLERASLDTSLRPSTRQTMLNEIQQLEARKREVEKEAQRAEIRAASYERRLPENWQQQTHDPIRNERYDQQQQRGMTSGMKKLLGYGLVAAGGFGIGSYLGQSRSDYRQAIEHEGPLFARGVKGSRERAGAAAGMGISPLEYFGIEERLSASTGLSDKTGIGNHALLTGLFAKSQGVGADQAVNIRENVYHATGNNGTLPSAALLAIGNATSTGMDKSKVSELLTQISRNMDIAAKAAGGAGLSKDQLAAQMAFAVESLKLGGEQGVFAKSQELGGFMQNGMNDAGTPAGNLMLFNALGGFNGQFDYAKIHQMNKVKSEGFLQHPEVLENILKHAPQITGKKGTEEYQRSLDARAGWMQTHFHGSMKMSPKATETLIEMEQSGFFKKLTGSKKNMLSELEGQAKGGDKQAARWLEEIKQNPALARQSTEATKDAVRIEAGEKLSKLFQPLELSAAKMTEALASGEWKKSFSILGDAAGEMGPAAKIMMGAAGLYAAGGAMGMIGGILNLGKGGIGGAAGAAGATSLLGRLAPLLLNPVTGGAAVIGGTMAGLGYLGDRNDTKLKQGQSDKELKDRYSQLEVAGAHRGPEGQRIPEELKRRQSGINRFNNTTTITNADGTTTHRKGSRNWANHNPGNIEYGDFAKSHGAIGSDGRFAVFADYKTGRKAKEQLLFGENSKYRNLSISDAIERWAPKSENPNNAHYKAAAIRAAGGKDVKLSALTQEQREKMMNEMEKQEGFRPGTEWTTRGTGTTKIRPWDVDQSKYSGAYAGNWITDKATGGSVPKIESSGTASPSASQPTGANVNGFNSQIITLLQELVTNSAPKPAAPQIIPTGK